MRVPERLVQKTRRSSPKGDGDTLLHTLHHAPSDAEPLTYEERVIVEAEWHAYQQGQVVPLDAGVQPPARRSTTGATGADWAAVVTPSARHELGQIEIPIRMQMIAALQRMLSGRQCNLRKHSDLDPPTWTLRNGNWQLVLRCSRREREIVVLRANWRRPAAMTV